MKITLENTSQVINLVTEFGDFPARVWEGETDSGIKVIAYITRIAVDKNESQAAIQLFEKELLEQKAPSAAVQSFSLRQIL